MHSKRAILQIVLTLVAIVGVACGGTRQFALAGSNQAPGADGVVRIALQESGNFMVSVSTTNMLPPSRVDDSLTTYVVWFQPANRTPQRVGILAYNEGDRSGEMTATTANTSFQVVISGEISADVAAPGDHVVFRASVEAPL